MSTHRSSSKLPPIPQHLLATGIIRLANSVQSLEDEVALQHMLEEVPGVASVIFPSDEQIEVRYNSSVTGERTFEDTLRRAGYLLADFGQRRNASSAMRHSAIRPYPPRAS